MQTYTDKTQASKSQSTDNAIAQQQSCSKPTFKFIDNRPGTVLQQKQQMLADTSLQVAQLKASQQMASHGSQSMKGDQVQATVDNPPVQRKTGLPVNLQSGIENLSGYDMSDVNVHYNSSKPAQLQAHAYTQGTDIHVGSGQEKHLPHEAWHVVQQKQGRVKPTLQMKGKVSVNDDAGLEKEADLMGEKALQMKAFATGCAGDERGCITQLTSFAPAAVVQMKSNVSKFLEEARQDINVPPAERTSRLKSALWPKSSKEKQGASDKPMPKDSEETVKAIRALLAGWSGDNDLSSSQVKLRTSVIFSGHSHREAYLNDIVDNGGSPSFKSELMHAAGLVASTKVDSDEIMMLLTEADSAELQSVSNELWGILQNKTKGRFNNGEDEFIAALRTSQREIAIKAAEAPKGEGGGAAEPSGGLVSGDNVMKEFAAIRNYLFKKESGKKTTKLLSDNGQKMLQSWANRHEQYILENGEFVRAGIKKMLVDDLALAVNASTVEKIISWLPKKVKLTSEGEIKEAFFRGRNKSERYQLMKPLVEAKKVTGSLEKIIYSNDAKATEELKKKLGKAKYDYFNQVLVSNQKEAAFEQKDTMSTDLQLRMAKVDELARLVGVIIDDGSAMDYHSTQIGKAREVLVDWAKNQKSMVRKSIGDTPSSYLRDRIFELTGKKVALQPGIELIKTIVGFKSGGEEETRFKDQALMWIPKFKKDFDKADSSIHFKDKYKATSRLGSYAIQIYQENDPETAVKVLQFIWNDPKIEEGKKVLSKTDRRELIQLRLVMQADIGNVAARISKLSSAEIRIDTITEGTFAAKGVRKEMLARAISDSDGLSLLSWTDIEEAENVKDNNYVPALNQGIYNKLNKNHMESGVVSTAYFKLMHQLADAIEKEGEGEDSALRKTYWEKTGHKSDVMPPAGYFRARAALMRGHARMVQQQYSESGVQWESFSGTSSTLKESKDVYRGQLRNLNDQAKEGKNITEEELFSRLEKTDAKYDRRLSNFNAVREKYTARAMMVVKFVLMTATTLATMGLGGVGLAGVGLQFLTSLLPTAVSATIQQGAMAYMQGSANYDAKAGATEIVKAIVLAATTVGAGQASGAITDSALGGAAGDEGAKAAFMGLDRAGLAGQLLEKAVVTSSIEAASRQAVETVFHYATEDTEAESILGYAGDTIRGVLFTTVSDAALKVLNDYVGETYDLKTQTEKGTDGTNLKNDISYFGAKGTDSVQVLKLLGNQLLTGQTEGVHEGDFAALGELIGTGADKFLTAINGPEYGEVMGPSKGPEEPVLQKPHTENKPVVNPFPAAPTQTTKPALNKSVVNPEPALGAQIPSNKTTPSKQENITKRKNTAKKGSLTKKRNMARKGNRRPIRKKSRRPAWR